MSPSILVRRRPIGPRSGIAAAVAVGCFLLPVVASAQAKKKAGAEHEKKTGKVASVEKKGKSATLVVDETGGDKLEVPLNARTKLVVNGTGDAEFFKHPRTFVSSDSVFTANRQYFGRKFTVHFGHNPPAKFEADENNAEVFHIAGPIVDCDDSSFTIDVEGQPCKVNFEQGADLSVAIVSSEPEHAVAGSPVEVEGMTRAGRFVPTAVVVNLDRPLTADDAFPAEGDKKGAKGKTTSASKTTKKSAKTDKGDKGSKDDDPAKTDDAPAATDTPTTGNDPFKVNNDTGKKTAKKKTSTPKTPRPKKPSEDDDMDN